MSQQAATSAAKSTWKTATVIALEAKKKGKCFWPNNGFPTEFFFDKIKHTILSPGEEISSPVQF